MLCQRTKVVPEKHRKKNDTEHNSVLSHISVVKKWGHKNFLLR